MDIYSLAVVCYRLSLVLSQPYGLGMIISILQLRKSRAQGTHITPSWAAEGRSLINSHSRSSDTRPPSWVKMKIFLLLSKLWNKKENSFLLILVNLYNVSCFTASKMKSRVFSTHFTFIISYIYIFKYLVQYHHDPTSIIKVWTNLLCNSAWIIYKRNIFSEGRKSFLKKKYMLFVEKN